MDNIFHNSSPIQNDLGRVEAATRHCWRQHEETKPAAIRIDEHNSLGAEDPSGTPSISTPA